MESISTRLKIKRESKKLSQRQLGRLVSVSATAISQWERGETAPKGEHLLNLSKALGCTPEWLTGKKGAQELPEDMIKIPFYCDEKSDIGLSESRTFITLPRSFFKYHYEKELVAICVHGDSMEPVLKDNSIVVIDTNISPLRDGGMYVFRQGDLIRVKLISQVVGGLCLKSYNSNYEDELYSKSEVKSIKLLGRVVWHSSYLI